METVSVIRGRRLLFPAVLMFILTVAVPVLHAQSTVDELLAAPLGPGGCYNLTLLNQNSGGLLIDKLQLRILTPGSLWHYRTKAPVSWNVAAPQPESLVFNTTSAPLRPGGRLVLQNLCLDPVCDQASTVAVLWEAFSGATRTTIDTLLLDCVPLDRIDSVSVRDSAGVFIATVHNRNSYPYAIDGFSVTSMTPGVTLTARTNNDWDVVASMPDSANFAATTAGIAPGSDLGGFVIDPTITGGAIPPFVFHWRTTLDRRGISSGTFTAGVEERRDTIRWHAMQQSVEGTINFQGLTLRNTHAPAGPIDRLRVQILTSDILFSDSTSGPWSQVAENPRAMRFFGTPPLAANDSVVGIVLALTNSGSGSTVRLRWQTFNGTTQITNDTVDLFCPPTAFAVTDTFSVQMEAGCVAAVSVKNTHTPASGIDSLTIAVATGFEDLLSVDLPSGWQVSTQSQTHVTLVKMGGLAAGESAGAFLLGFSQRLKGQPFPVTLRSWYRGRLIGEELHNLACLVETERCDSLIVEHLGGVRYSFRVRNQHHPVSDVTALSFSVQNAEAVLNLGTLPSGWTLDSIRPTYLRVTASGAGVPPGAESAGIELQISGNMDSTVLMRWCSEDAAGVLCCQSYRLILPPWRGCDSLEVTQHPERCSAELKLHNIHSSGTTIVSLDIRVTTPGRVIDTAYATGGWKVVRYAANRVNFSPIDTANGLLAGATLDGLSVHFGPAGESGDLEFEWITFNRQNGICAQRVTVGCALQSTGCDSLMFAADTAAPCCFDLAVVNLRAPASVVDSVLLRVLTAGVIVYQSTVTSPIGWLAGGDETQIGWSSRTFPIVFGELMTGFGACFDNDAIGNDPFEVEISSFDAEEAVCVDTVLLRCGQTLAVAGAPLPERTTIAQNYPNPFTTSTTIVYDLERSGVVRLEVLDATGRIVRDAVNGFLQAGRHSVQFDAASLPPGAYFVRLRSGGTVHLRVMTLLR